MSYLGYPGTMGADFIDYIIADATVIPPNTSRFYAEKIVHLPDCYQVNDSQAADRRAHANAAGSRACRRTASSSAASTTTTRSRPRCSTSGCDCCTRSRAACCGCLATTPRAERNLRKEAQARGVDPARLVFAGRMCRSRIIWRATVWPTCSSIRCRTTPTRRRATRCGQVCRC